MFEKSNTKVIEIYSLLVIENHNMFAISKEATKNLSTFIGKIEIRMLFQDSVI